MRSCGTRGNLRNNFSMELFRDMAAHCRLQDMGFTVRPGSSYKGMDGGVSVIYRDISLIMLQFFYIAVQTPMKTPSIESQGDFVLNICGCNTPIFGGRLGSITGVVGTF